MLNIHLKNKKAIVGGSTQGIGLAIAKQLAQCGAELVLIARNEEKLKSIVASLEIAYGQQHSYLVADFSAPESLAATLLKVPPIQAHILINNTGGPPAGPVLESSLEELTQALHSHLFCAHMLVQHVVPFMKSVKFGRIVNIISTSVKQPIPGLGVSNTTRGAVANWAKTLSLELGPFGITVNNVLPGATMTKRHESLLQQKADKQHLSIQEVTDQMLKTIPLARFGTPEELAYGVAFLVSDLAAYISGINLPIDGGRTGNL